MTSFYFVFMLIAALFLPNFADEPEPELERCYFYYYRMTEYEKEIQDRLAFSLVSPHCFGKKFRFDALDVKSVDKSDIKSSNTKNPDGIVSNAVKNLHGADTILALILARGQGLFDWRTAPSKEMIIRQQWHLKEIAKRKQSNAQHEDSEHQHQVQQHNNNKLKQFLKNNFVCQGHLNELVNKWADSHKRFKAHTFKGSEEGYYCAFNMVKNNRVVMPDLFDKPPAKPHLEPMNKSVAHALQKDEAKYILETFGLLMHIGIPVCKWHEDKIIAGMRANHAGSTSTADEKEGSDRTTVL
ncbi:hypothetical protein GPALN_014862 [Globodera pallida]|nr:hypothetical protein GPALN_014862 [Globodera pallida]